MYIHILFEMELLLIVKLVKSLLFYSSELHQSLLLYSLKLKEQIHIGHRLLVLSKGIEKHCFLRKYNTNKK